MNDKINTLYAMIEEYARNNQLKYTGQALPMIRDIMNKKARNSSVQMRYQAELFHCFEVCEMLMDLHISLSCEEEDVLLAAVLLHIYPEHFQVEDLKKKLVDELSFDMAIYEIIDTIVPERDQTDEERNGFYRRVQENKLALLALLADRGNIIQQLYRLSTWDAHRYIDETKACYYPMCIYGKEHYYDLLAPISVLMEKMKSLIEVTEVLLRRYEVREAELMQDILALREENATIKGIISKFKEA